MTVAQIINAVLFFIWPAIFALAFVLFHFLIQRLPAHTRLAHRQFAREAVEKVEQQNPGMQGQAKKALAITEVNALCDDYNLPHPRSRAMDTHLESSVYRLKSGQRHESDTD